MAKNDSLVLSVLKMKCPYCKEGALFKHPNPYNFSKMMDMYEECPVCTSSYEPEPGFYYGAMVISYILSGFTALPTLAILHLVYDVSIGFSVLLMISLLLILMPLFFRYSRATWLAIYKVLN